MISYLTILFVAWWLSAKVEKLRITNAKAAKNYKRVLITVLTCFIGFRFNVGADYFAYIYDYGKFLEKSYSETLFSSDFAFKLMAKFGSLVYDSPTTMFFCAAFLFVLLFINTLYKYSEHFSLSVVLFILCGTYLESCNAIRQSMAMAIIFSGYACIRERTLGKYILLVLLAMAFHSSAIVMLPLFFILSCPAKLNKLLWPIGIALSILVSYSGLFNFAEMITGKAINLEEVAYFTTSVNILRVAVAVAPCILVPFLKKGQYEKLALPINLIILNAVLMCVTSQSAYLARVAMYSNAFLCLALPKLLYNLRIAKESISGIKSSMLVCYAIFWIYGIFNSAGLYPYQTIFTSH
ncbi:MAG: EpsG family protein [Selenomonadaceae bacterium]